jgi:hypothetical protein
VTRTRVDGPDLHDDGVIGPGVGGESRGLLEERLSICEVPGSVEVNAEGRVPGGTGVRLR